MHELYKQKRHCKGGRNFYKGENIPPKRDPGFTKVRSLLDGTIHFHK